MKRRAIVLFLALFAAPAGADTVYVSNEQANVVHVIDGVTKRLVGTIAVGARPRGMALSPDGQELYVASGNGNRIDVIELAQRRVVDSLPSGPDPERFAVSPDGQTIYVANENDSKVSFIDIRRKRIKGEVEVGAEPEGMAVSPDGRLLVATSETASLVHFIDTGSGRLIDSIMVGTRPRDAHFSADGKHLWVSSETRATVAQFDVASRQVIRTIDFDNDDRAPENVQAVGLALNTRGDRLFVALGRGNHVAEVDAGSGRILRYFAAGSRNWGLALSADGKMVYAANGLSADLSIIDLDHPERSVQLPLGGKPWGVVTVP